MRKEENNIPFRGCTTQWTGEPHFQPTGPTSRDFLVIFLESGVDEKLFTYPL